VEGKTLVLDEVIADDVNDIVDTDTCNLIERNADVSPWLGLYLSPLRSSDGDGAVVVDSELMSIVFVLFHISESE
jgi:hypothetical protein